MKASQLQVGAEYAYAHRPGVDVDVSDPYLTRVRYAGLVERPGRYSFDKPVQCHAFDVLDDDGKPQDGRGARRTEKTARCILGTWDEHVEASKARRASEAAASAKRRALLAEAEAEAAEEAARWRALGVSVFIGSEYEQHEPRPVDFPFVIEYEAAVAAWKATERARREAAIQLVPEVGGVKLVRFRYADLVALREQLTDREW